jgi:hypothetical protein
VFSDKLCSLLVTFGKVELNRLRKFVASPYFCDEPDVLRLYDLCLAALRKDPDALPKLSKEKIWKKLWPERPFDDLQLRRLASELTQLAIRFRAIEHRAHDPIPEWLDQQKALEHPGLEKHLAGVERQLMRQFDDTVGRNTAFYFQNFRYHWQVFVRSYRLVANTDYMGKLLPADHFLECFYVVQKLKMYVAWLSYRQYRSTDREVPLPPGFWQHVESQQFVEVPMVGIYRQVIRLLLDSTDESLFQALMADLDERGHALAAEDLRECYFIAQNYCAIMINRGSLDYYQRAFEIFKKMVERDVLLEDGSLAEGIYKNVITSGLRALEFGWVEQFVETYSDFLPVSIRDNARAYNLANLYSHQRQYDRALEVLRSVEYTDVTYALGAKTILLRVYYEQGEYLALDSLIDSFRIFLRRNAHISTNLKKEYNNFLNLVRKLTTLRVGDHEALEAFREKVRATSYNTPKKWLLDKIAELAGPRGGA